MTTSSEILDVLMGYMFVLAGLSALSALISVGAAVRALLKQKRGS